MDLLYYNHQIRDELSGARQYIEKAMEDKQTYPTRARMYVEMSASELAHAGNLFKMFEECYKELYDDKETNESFKFFLDKFRSEVVQMYTQEAANVRYLHELYTK